MQQSGFGRTELVVVIVLIGLAGFGAYLMLRPTENIQGDVQRVQQITCENNLKQMGTSYLVFANDNEGRFPFAVPAQRGGWSEIVATNSAGAFCWANYAAMGAELISTRVLACPQDIRKPAANFTVLTNNLSVSYFAGVKASESAPRSLLGGDRNVDPGEWPEADYGFSPSNGAGNDVTVTDSICWSLMAHSKGDAGGKGNVLLADGSVQAATSTELRHLVHDSTERRIVFP